MMAMFRKPKKNIRRRFANSDEDEETNCEKKTEEKEEQEDITEIQSNIAKFKEKKEKRKQQQQAIILSFEEELDEADGEVFQVKKSSQSRKLMKQIEKEKKRKKEDKDTPAVSIVEKGEKIESKVASIAIQENMKKEVPKSKEDEQRVPNGKESNALDIEPHKEGDMKSRYSQPDSFKYILESGVIPDAAMIHAARKRRQLARDLGDVIPLDDTQRSETSKSRLVRDDDNDQSDEEERLDFTVNTSQRDRERRREAFLAAQEQGSGSESERGDDELERWESQQILKGVSGTQYVPVQSETLLQQYLSATNTVPPVHTSSAPVSATYSDTTSASIATSTVTEPGVPESTKPKNYSAESIKQRLKDRLTSLQEVHQQHTLDRDKIQDDLIVSQSTILKLELEGPVVGERFKFYQELRGYVTDLVECLDEKVTKIEYLERCMHSLLKQRTERMMHRRQQDIKDQSEENTPTSSKVTSTNNLTEGRNRDEDESHARRAAEREGRRTRRRRVRELKGLNSKHYDGMSSDDEETESEITIFRNEKERIESDSQSIFDDVVDEFCTLRGIKQRFESWKSEDLDSYRDAYVSLCLPKIFSPIIRLQLISWNPFEESGEFEQMRWYDSLVLYGLREMEEETDLHNDPDLKLVSLVVEKITVPKLTQLVETAWDPMSTSQTLRLVGLVNRMVLEYPTVNGSSKQVQELIRTIIAKMRSSLDNDIFMPLYPKQVLEKSSGASTFFQRQFWSTVKLMRNFLSWQGVISDKLLQELALDGLLNRYMLLALRNTGDMYECLEKCRIIVSTFPRWWFQKETSLAQLQLFVRYLVSVSQSADSSTPSGREAIEEIVSLLKTIGAPDQSEDISRKYL